MLLIGWLMAGCNEDDTVIIVNETTQEGAITQVLQGYESVLQVFSICKPEAGSKRRTLESVPHLIPIWVARLIK